MPVAYCFTVFYVEASGVKIKFLEASALGVKT